MKVVHGTVVVYMALSDGRLVLVSSTNRKYHVYAFDASQGSPLWNKSVNWLSDNHGGHMSRPAIVGDTLYVRPHVFEMTTGKLLPIKMPKGGCGTYSCTSNSIFFRDGTVKMWDRRGGKTTTWNRLRPDCWLSTIAAGGMLLAPEGGGGCSCGKWMETSIGFIPKILAKTQKKN